ncbi:MAG: hypothetical protein II393_03910 [Cytophagales bacterium]|nr:hypothetical protein [Cytophagales bacterium]
MFYLFFITKTCVLLATLFTFVIGVVLNLLSNFHHVDSFRVNASLKTYVLHVTAEKDIDIGGGKIDDLLYEHMSKALKEYNVKSKEKDGDVDIKIHIDKFTSEKVIGSDDKLNVIVAGKVSLKNIHDDSKSFSDKSFHESIEIDETDKDKKLTNAKKILESYCKKFIETNLG